MDLCKICHLVVSVHSIVVVGVAMVFFYPATTKKRYRSDMIKVRAVA